MPVRASPDPEKILCASPRPCRMYACRKVKNSQARTGWTPTRYGWTLVVVPVCCERGLFFKNSYLSKKALGWLC